MFLKAESKGELTSGVTTSLHQANSNKS